MNIQETKDIVIVILSRRARTLKRIQRLVNRLSFAPVPVVGVIRGMVQSGEIIETDNGFELA